MCWCVMCAVTTTANMRRGLDQSKYAFSHAINFPGTPHNHRVCACMCVCVCVSYMFRFECGWNVCSNPYSVHNTLHPGISWQNGLIGARLSAIFFKQQQNKRETKQLETQKTAIGKQLDNVAAIGSGQTKECLINSSYMSPLMHQTTSNCGHMECDSAASST